MNARMPVFLSRTARVQRRRLAVLPARALTALLLAAAAGGCAGSQRGQVPPPPAAPALAPTSATKAAPAVELGPAADETLSPELEAAIEALRPAIARIVEYGLEHGRAHELMLSLCEAAPQRLSGSPGAAAAVEWARLTMHDLNFDSVTLQPCLVPRWVRGEVQELVIVEPAAHAGMRLAAMALGNSGPTPRDGLLAQVVRVAAPDDAPLPDVAGAIVFFDRPMEAGLADPGRAYGRAVGQRSRGPVRARDAGAAGVLVRSMTTRLDDVVHVGNTQLTRDAPLPAAAVSTLAAETLARLLEAGPVTVKLSLSAQLHEDVPSANVIGELRGRELPDEIVLVSGHLDSWDVGHGAHDDAGGCVQALETLRLLDVLELRPRRSLRAVLFMNEENGLRGARAYRDAAALEAVEGRRHLFAMESDSGVSFPHGISTNAGPQAAAILRRVGAMVEELAGAGRVVPGSGGADVDPLIPLGVVVAGLDTDLQRYFDLHHTEADRVETVWPRELQLGACVMAAFAYAVAELPVSLPANPVAAPVR